MSLADVERIAMELSEPDRGRLAVVLLDSVASKALGHAADEADRREGEMEEGGLVKSVTRSC